MYNRAIKNLLFFIFHIFLLSLSPANLIATDVFNFNKPNDTFNLIEGKENWLENRERTKEPFVVQKVFFWFFHLHLIDFSLNTYYVTTCIVDNVGARITLFVRDSMILRQI